MTVTTLEATELIDLDLIEAGDNDRTTFDPAELEALAESLNTLGLIAPVVLRPVGDRYRIVGGERRCRAAKLAGWTQVTAIVRHDLDDVAEAAIMLAENMVRVQLSPMQISDAFQKRVDAGSSLEDIARDAGYKVETVRYRLRLQSLCPEARHLLHTEQMTLSQAWYLCDLDSNRQIVAIRALSAAPGMTYTAFRDLCEKLQAEQDQATLFELANEAVEIQKAGGAKRTPRRQLEETIAAQAARIAELEALLAAKEVNMLAV